MDDSLKWNILWVISKYAEGDDPLYCDPIEVIDVEGNLLTYGGASWLLDRLVNGGSVTNHFDATNGYVGVGDSSTAAARTQTDLQASSNKHYEVLDAAPTHTDGTAAAAATMTFACTFESADAQFAWNEIGLFNASSGGRMLNRKVVDLGTKGATAWTVNGTVTIA